jgi:hypothetical protein
MLKHSSRQIIRIIHIFVSKCPYDKLSKCPDWRCPEGHNLNIYGRDKRFTPLNRVNGELNYDLDPVFHYFALRNVGSFSYRSLITLMAWLGDCRDMETGLSLQTAPTQQRQPARPSFTQIVTSNSNMPEDNNYFSSSSEEGA